MRPGVNWGSRSGRARCVGVIMVGLIGLWGGAASAQSDEPPPEPGLREHLFSNLAINGYLRNETAFRINRPASLVKVMNIVNLEPRYSFGPRAQLNARVRAFYDAAYDLIDVDTLSPRKG